MLLLLLFYHCGLLVQLLNLVLLVVFLASYPFSQQFSTGFQRKARKSRHNGTIAVRRSNHRFSIAQLAAVGQGRGRGQMVKATVENDGFRSRARVSSNCNQLNCKCKIQNAKYKTQNANTNSNGLRFLMALMEKKTLI